MKAEPIIIDRTYNAAPERVWKALTDGEQMKKWYFDIAEFKPVAGFEFRFTGGTEEKKYTHICKITDIVPGKKLAYSWRYDGVQGISYVTFEVIKEGNQTRVRLTHKGIDSFPTDDPNMKRESFIAGWTHIIGTSLKGYVESAAV
ncbi:MAG TPA: SRPBCC domain-containing protein [Bacteroidota bacterium]|nr:SRPBCC domain-containing protein [Bacteroidota bacterium]